MAPDHEHPSTPSATLDEASLDEGARLLSALGDTERLRILDLIGDGEVCVSQLAEATGAGMTTVSQRLRVLRERGLITSRREGKHIYYALADEHVSDLVQIGISHALEIGGGRGGS